MYCFINIFVAIGNDGNQPRGATYDEMSLPTEMGSGGHSTKGGGFISITSQGTITVDGTISAKSVFRFFRASTVVVVVVVTDICFCLQWRLS